MARQPEKVGDQPEPLVQEEAPAEELDTSMDEEPIASVPVQPEEADPTVGPEDSALDSDASPEEGPASATPRPRQRNQPARNALPDAPLVVLRDVQFDGKKFKRGELFTAEASPQKVSRLIRSRHITYKVA
jgi:hypothetical protein